MTDTRVFKDNARRETFWQRLYELLADYPEMMEGLDAILNGAMDQDGLLYDDTSPKFIQGVVMVISVRNLDEWESMFVIDPPPQSTYFTMGLLAAGLDMY